MHKMFCTKVNTVDACQDSRVNAALLQIVSQYRTLYEGIKCKCPGQRRGRLEQTARGVPALCVQMHSPVYMIGMIMLSDAVQI